MYPEAQKSYSVHGSQQVQPNAPKAPTHMEAISNNLESTNDHLWKAASRLEDALNRLGWHENAKEPKDTGIAPVPNGHIGTLGERLSSASNAGIRLHSLLDALETYL